MQSSEFTIITLNLAHCEECKPSALQVAVSERSRGKPTMVSVSVMSELHKWVSIGANTNQIRRFLLENHLTSIPRDAATIRNLKLRVLRAHQKGILGRTSLDDLKDEMKPDALEEVFQLALQNSLVDAQINEFVELVSRIIRTARYAR